MTDTPQYITIDGVNYMPISEMLPIQRQRDILAAALRYYATEAIYVIPIEIQVEDQPDGVVTAGPSVAQAALRNAGLEEKA
jgi:hypothetical protein